MTKPPGRKQPSRKSKAAKDDDARSDGILELKLVEPIRLLPVAPTLWRDSLKRLGTDFLSAREQHGPLRCPLFQDSTSNADRQKPPIDKQVDEVATHGTIYNYVWQNVEPDGKPIYATQPIADAKGKPIVDSQGRGMLRATAVRRHWTYCGTSAAGAPFTELAKRAGRALLGSPERTIAWIPRDTLFAQGDENRWVWSIFDLAWQGRHPSLRADRKTWFRPARPIPGVKANVVYVPYDVQRLRSMREGASTPLFSFPKEWTERLPGYFISELPDLLQASADLIDVLLDMAAQAEREAQQSQASSDATESSTHGSAPRRGGKPPVSKSEARKREELVERWKRAKAEGVRQKAFCADANVALKHLTRCINWCTQRGRRNAS